MDSIFINSWLFRGIMSKFLTKTVNVKFGADAKVALDQFYLTHKNGRTKMRIGFEIDASDEDVIKFVRGMGE